MSEPKREAEMPWDFWQICRRTRESFPPKIKVFSFYTGQHMDVSSIWVYKMKKFFLLHFVWMLHLQQWNWEEIKLLNNRVLNIAGTNNRITERIKSYPLGFGTFGGSQLLTHSPNKLRSSMSWCWPSEGGSAQQPQLPRWFQPLPSWSSVSRGHAPSQPLRLMSGTTSMQGRELGTGETRRDAHKVRHLHCLCLRTHFCQSCAGASTDTQIASPVGEEGFKPWARKVMDPRGCREKKPKSWHQQTRKELKPSQCWWGICPVDTKVPIASSWVTFRLREPTKSSLTLQEDESWQ